MLLRSISPVAVYLLYMQLRVSVGLHSEQFIKELKESRGWSKMMTKTATTKAKKDMKLGDI